MATDALVHPADETLVSYGLGKLDDTLAESVGKHLEQCDPCRQRVAELSSDSFVARLQNAKPQQESKPPVPQPVRAKTLVEAEPPRPSPAPKAPSSMPLATSGSLPAELVNHQQYEVIRELGRGGMGVVYLARNKLMDRLEVLKVLSKEMLGKQGRSDRFLREIQSAAKLHHPNVVAAYTAFPLGETLCFAMEYVEGDDLAKLVRARGPLPVLNACYFAYQTAQGLAHAHERGMIHRDIKPGNLILFRQGKKGTVKILDFGLAKVTSEQRIDGTLTQQGQMLGTPDYIAPEQTLDAQKADIRADIYSLGCTLYHLLTGSPPFSGNSLYQVLQAHHSVEARPLNLVRPEVPVELAAVVAKMMAKDPNRRYQTPAEVVQALKPFLKPGGLTSPQPELSQSVSDIERPSATPIAAAATPDEEEAPFFAPMEPVEPSERWKSLIDTPSLERLSTARSAFGKPPWRQPPWIWASVAIGLAVFGLISAWASGVFSVKTRDGVIVLQDLPDNAEVLVDGDKVRVRFPEGGGPAEITVPPGKRGVQVKKDGFQAFGDEVRLASGEKKLLSVRLDPLPQKTSTKPPDLLAAPFDRTTAEKGQASWAAHLQSPVEITNKAGMRLTLVPPGRFEMGSTESRDQLRRAFPAEAATNNPDFQPLGEGPVHPVTISRPFYLGKYEVTKRQFMQFVDDVGYRTDAEKDGKGGWGYDANKNQLLWGWHPNFTWRNWGAAQADDAPVVNVSHKDATEFCVWLSNKEGKHYRLPTEAEWEYACRAGTTDPYYNGHDPEQLTKIGNVNDATLRAKFPGLLREFTLVKSSDGYAFSSPVGRFLPNNFGLYDMLGNVWEWCADWYDEDYYWESPVLDPAGPPSGQKRVLRGGSWINGGMHCCAAKRLTRLPYDRSYDLGFRVVLSVAGSAAEVSQKPAEQDPHVKKADYDAIATGKWIPVLERETDLRGGTLVIPEHRAGDAIIRARVKKFSGQNLDLSLRRDEARRLNWRGYSAWFNGGNWFGISKWSEGAKDLRQWHAPVSFDDYFEFAFSAVGETLTIYADGKRIGEVRDLDYRVGSFAISALLGRSQFQNVELMILDKSVPSTDEKGFVPLFNGKDLRGWETHPSHSGNWRVDGDGILVGSGSGVGYLYTERNDFKNFHLRVEARFSKDGNSGVFFRTRFGPCNVGRWPICPLGYQAEIIDSLETGGSTGGLFTPLDGGLVIPINSPAKPGEWFTMEITADGNHLIIQVNGKRMTEYRDPKQRFVVGHLALEQWGPTVVEFRKIEIKELPANVSPSGAGTLSALNFGRIETSVPSPQKEAAQSGAPLAAGGELAAANKQFTEAVKRAREKLLSRLNSHVKSLETSPHNSEQQLTLIADARQERDAFAARGLIPWSAHMRGPLLTYLNSIHNAEHDLELAFDKLLEHATKNRDEHGRAELAAQKEVFLAPRVIATCDFIAPNGIKRKFTFYSNGKLGRPNGRSSWVFHENVLVLTVQGPNKLTILRCTLAPDGKTCTAVNQEGHRYTARFVDP